MVDDTDFEHEADMSRANIADLLETFADDLRGAGEVELAVGDRTIVLEPPETVEFEVEVEDEPEADGVERSVEFELEWLRRDDEEPLGA